MRKFLYLSLSILTTASLLSGCGLSRENAASANLTIQSAKYLNPDLNGNPSPVVVALYQLSTPYTFKQTTYQALMANSAKALGSSLIDKNTIEVRPNIHKSIQQSISPNTHYLGIVADYRKTNSATWKKVIKIVNKPGKITGLNLNLESEAISITLNNRSPGFAGFKF